MKYFAGILVLSLLLFGCLGGNTKSNAAQNTIQTTANPQVTFTLAEAPIKIGVIVPLTGDMASFGTSLVKSVQLASDEVNSKGGINGRQIQLVVEDGVCSPKSATDAANKLVNVDHVKIIIGGLCSGESLATIPIAEKEPAVVFSPCSSSPKLTGASKYFARDYPSDAFQGIVGAQFMSNKGIKKVAVLYGQNDYSVALKEVFKKEAARLGIQVVDDESFTQDTSDLKTQLTKIIGAGAEGFYMPDYTQAFITGLKEAKELGYTGLILGTESGSDPAIVAAIKDAPNFVYTSPKVSDSVEAKDFEAKYKQTYGSEPLLCSSYGYDAIHLLAQVVSKTGENPDAMSSELRGISNYPGASGSITIGENGDLSTASYDFHTYRNGKIVPYTDTG